MCQFFIILAGIQNDISSAVKYDVILSTSVCHLSVKKQIILHDELLLSNKKYNGLDSELPEIKQIQRRGFFFFPAPDLSPK